MAGLYIHVPFCAKRCLYCDFHSNTEMVYKEAYINALIREMELRKDYLDGEPMETIYFGGGTPSRLNADDYERIFAAIDRNFDSSACHEITLEANPDDMTSGYVRSLTRLPFNRISMGVQSFDPEDLRFLRRRHDRDQALRAVRLCKENGFTNLSVDLIYGLPGQTPEKWSDNLDEVLRLDIPHISAYHLIYEEGTPLYAQLEAGQVRPVDEDTSVTLFSSLIDTLTTAGYEHYEISNFALPGYISRHNSSYWMGRTYLGLGPSAHSYNGDSREWVVSSLPLYLKSIAEGKPDIEKEILDTRTRYNDYIITRLRTHWGISYNEIDNLFGEDYALYCRRQASSFIMQGLLHETGQNLRFSPSGIFLSDTVMRELIK